MKMFDGNIPTKEFFIFLRYNTIPQEGKDLTLSETDQSFYEEFVSKVKNLQSQLDDSSNAAKATSSALFSMFGFNRHYCSMTGQPIVGKYYKIGGKIVSKEAYEAHKIVQEIERKEEQLIKSKARRSAENYLETSEEN